MVNCFNKTFKPNYHLCNLNNIKKYSNNIDNNESLMTDKQLVQSSIVNNTNNENFNSSGNKLYTSIKQSNENTKKGFRLNPGLKENS